MNGVTRNVEQADVRIIGGIDFLLRVGALGDLPFHVGLSRTNPGLTDEYVFEFDPVFPLNDKNGWRGIGLEGTKLDHPIPSFIGGRQLGLTGKGDGNLFSGFTRSPNRHGHVALQDHVWSDDIG